MEWLVVLGIIVLFGLWRLFRQPKRHEIKGMSAKDIGEIADQLWNDWNKDN